MIRAWRSAASLRDVVDEWTPGSMGSSSTSAVIACGGESSFGSSSSLMGRPDPPVIQFQAVIDRDEVARAMRGLDADQRIVVVLHYWGGVTLEGVADRLGWPLGTVKSRLHRALQQMRASLDGAAATAEGSR